jgi:hypothetical protein
MYHGFYELGSSEAILATANIERGYLWIYNIANFFHSFYAFNIINWFFICAFAYFSIKLLRLNSSVFWGFYVISFVYFVTFNMVRQFTAICIVYLGLLLLLRNFQTRKHSLFASFVCYALFVLVAQYFHSSAIIALLLPFSYFMPVTPLSTILSMIVTTGVYFSGIVNKAVPVLINLFPRYVEKYSNELSFFSTSTKGIVELLPILIQFFILLLIVLCLPEFISNNKFISSLYLLYLLMFMGAGNLTLLRVQAYWLPSIVYFYTKLFTYSDPRKEIYLSSGIIKVICIVFWTAYCVFRIVTNTSGVYPYSSIL